MRGLEPNEMERVLVRSTAAMLAAYDALPEHELRSTDNGGTWSTFQSVSGGAYDLSQIGSRSIDAIGTTLWAGGEPGSLAVTQGILPLHRTNAPAAWAPSFYGATLLLENCRLRHGHVWSEA